MARMIPAFMDPHTASPGERFLFDRLAKAPGTKDWTVLHGLTLPHHIRQVEGEVDFVIVIPFLGIVCLEVKAHRNVHRDASGMWHLGAQRATARSPFKQASEAMHSLRKELVRQAPALDRVPFTSAVAFTHADCGLMHPTEWQDWQLLDARELLARPIDVNVSRIMMSARQHYRSVGKAWLADSREPTAEQVDALVLKLRPSFELVESRKTARARTKDELLRYTQEQYNALDSLASVRRLLFNGPAGTGKTFLAIEAARRAAAAGANVLLACYNRPLARWLQEQVGHERFEVKTFHAHLLDVAGRPETHDNDSWWSNGLPELALGRLLDRGPTHNVLILDEAQDLFSDAYLDCMDASLDDGLSAGQWSFFSDLERQALYGGTGDLDALKQRAPDAVRFDLFMNCRNTPSIAEYTRAVAGLESGYRRILRSDNGHMPETLFYNDSAEQGGLLSAAFARLRDRKIEPSDVAVLSSTRHNPAVAQLPADDPWRHRLDTDGKGKSGWARIRTVHSFKGLEAPVIVLTGIDDVTTAGAQALLYVALSRPTERLVVIADAKVRSELLKLASARLFSAEALA